MLTGNRAPAHTRFFQADPAAWRGDAAAGRPRFDTAAVLAAGAVPGLSAMPSAVNAGDGPGGFPKRRITIIFFSVIGAFSLRNNNLDVWTIFVAGNLGYVLRRYGYSPPAIVMGVILGQIGEEAFHQSMVLMDYRLPGFFE